MNDENNQIALVAQSLPTKISALSQKWADMISILETDVESDRDNGWILSVQAGEEAIRLMTGMKGELDGLLLSNAAQPEEENK